MADAERIMQGLAHIAVITIGYDDVISAAIELIERATPKPFGPESDEAFAVQSLRFAAERGRTVLITSSNGRYLARPLSKAVLAVLDRIEPKKEAANV